MAVFILRSYRGYTRHVKRYRDGYTARASSSLTGGLLGTAVLVLLVVSATSGSSY
jgi:hypothetical protein